ncbi:MAG: C4-dicarboxylate ABC transporter permease [Thiotrichaceae bacterium IS1]|nr:MAG: C4-dicarboxylate ABC transporter permease [Thiotrichaceae bacterium IS1]
MNKSSFQLFIFIEKIINIINTISEWSGRLVAWLILWMVLIIVYDVTMRKFLSIGSVTLQELQWHLFSLIFLIGAAYTFKHDDHVRVDVLYQSHWMNPYRRAWINLLGSLFILLPVCLLIISSSWPFIASAFTSGETSSDPGGLPYRFLLKSAIPLGFALLMLQGIADFLTNLLYILGYREVLPPPNHEIHP